MGAEGSVIRSITRGKRDFPMCCVHCPVMEALEPETAGKIGAVHIATDPICHGACQFVFDKNPDDISGSKA